MCVCLLCDCVGIDCIRFLLVCTFVVFLQVNRLCMWTLAAQEGLDQLEPELSCEHEVRAAVTELVFIDEQFMVASLEDGSVIMLKQVASANVS